MNTFYDYKGRLIGGKEVNFENFKGNVVLVVNTASGCGFTPQFEGLEELYRKYKDDGFYVLGFPSGDFKNQKFDTDEEIINFAKEKYDVTFPLFQKSHVKKDGANELFRWLTEEQDGFLTKDIKWNFTKFLIDREGNVTERYGSATKPEKIEDDIRELL